MSEGFRDCFVSEKGYEAIKKSMRSGNEFCIELAKCLQERCDAENAYTRALQKTENSFEKLAGKAKGTLAQALSTLAAEINKEAKAHSSIADILSNGISIPMKNLADAQAKERKSIEENLNSKLKEWNNQKDTDYKYRSRQFNKCREIEGLLVKISEASSGSKSSGRSKTSSASSSSVSVVSCVRPAGRFSSVSEKSSSNFDVKYQSNLEATIKKAEEDLERIEDKYHSATRNVELLRQNFDAEMCRACDKLQQMETDRLKELANYIRTYATSIETLSKSMNQITQNLFDAQIDPENDILVQVKSYNEPSEIEVLLYDIYAENEDNVMNEQKRILNLMNWIARLKKDIEIQQQTKNASQSSLRSAPVDDDSPDDDICSSSDGAMCSKQETVQNSIRQNDESSSNDDDDDDGGMSRAKKKEKKKCQVSNGRVSSEVFIDRQGAAILEELYRASLYKIETVYNRIKNLPRPNYENADKLTRTYTKDGTPTTLLRLPCRPATRTPPSAPTAMRCFAESMPVYQPNRKQVPTAKAEPPQPGWNLPYPPGPQAQPLLGACAAMSPQAASAAAAPPPPNTHVKALYDYTAKHDDELNLQTDDVIVLLKRRKDGWYQGNLKGKIGFFPGNYVTEL